MRNAEIPQARYLLWQLACCATRWLAGLALIVSFAVAAAAQDSQTTTVRLDGQTLFRVSGDEDVDSAVRAARVEQRLGALLENLEVIPPAVVTRSGEDWVISVAGVPVTRVSPLDAENKLASADVLARQWAAVLDRELARASERRLGLGGRFLAETRGAIRSAFASVLESALQIIPRLLAAILVIATFVLLASGVHRLLRALFRRTVKDRTLENLIKQLVYYSIVLLGIIIAAGALGFTPQALVAGLGLTGLVLGFALKDILSNFVSGLLILTLRPFQIGDQIVVGATEGAVERIELRATQIRTYDGRVALVPNGEVFTSRIVNNTADPIRRGNAALTLGYDVDLRLVVGSIRHAVPQVDGVLDRPVNVRIEELGPENILLDVSFWTDSRRSDFKDTCSAVRQQLLETLKMLGVALAEPEVYGVRPADEDAWRRVAEASPPRGGSG